MATRASSATPERDQRVADLRHFNRFYTRLIGLLDEGHLHSSFSLAEVRILFEVAHRDGPTASELARELNLDAGYVSRMLRGFRARGLLEAGASASDARRAHLRLTAAGARVFADLDRRACDDIRRLLDTLPDQAQRSLLSSLRTVEQLLGATAAARPAPPYILRDPHAGDMGWVLERHAVLYSTEYGWDERFEALVARILADYLSGHDPARERFWIAEREGEKIGCVLLVRHPDRPGVAKLRTLLVEPSARGLGLGARLVDECTRFARRAGYHTITLWTNTVLVSARRLYEAAGYRLVEEKPHDLFGAGLVGQTWELDLGIRS